MDQQSFLFQALIYLSAAVICVPLAKKAGIGSVLGYLLAGVAIGPAVLGFIGEEGQDIMHFAEFGVVMMLFLIGLELEPELLWKLRKSIVGLGGLQVLLSAVILGAASFLFGLNWKESLALGLILALSSTAIVIQSLNEKGLSKTAAGQSSFAVLLFQDIAVIPMLAIFPLLATYAGIQSAEDHASQNWVSGQPGWLHTLIVFGAIAGIILAGRFIFKPFLRLMAGIRIREIFVGAALLLVIGIAVLMTQVGLSPALGTFLGGVVLANSEYRHELESDIEPFKGLLLGLFFIAVGASIDFELIAQQPWLIGGLVFAVMTVKGLVLLALGRLFRMSWDQTFIFSFALSQMGEFAFVLFSFSLQEGILREEVVNIMIAVVAISMAVTPLVMLLNEKLILPHVGTKEDATKEADAIEEKNPVIIAGFGHFGNTVGRFLRANNINATYLDIDSDRVDLLRKMGFNVYYGDASRYDLLLAAGAEEARVIVIAIDNPGKRMEMVETVKKHFPHLHVYVRATNRYDAYDLMNAGMLHVYRESLDTSVRLGVDVMKILGYRSYTTQRTAQQFLKQDEINLKKLASVRDPDEYVVAAKGYIEEIETLLKEEREHPFHSQDSGWDPESLRNEHSRSENPA